MCYYRFYIFLGCGHTTFSSTPVRYCANATSLDDAQGPSLPEPTVTNKNMKTTTTGVVLDLEAGSQPQVTQAIATRDSQSLPSTEGRTIALASRISTPRLEPCVEGRAHPLHTRKVDSSCADCVQARDERLRKLESMPVEVKFKRRKQDGESPSKRTSKEMILQGKVNRPKVDSGVWATGTKWMEGWKGRGSG